MRFIDALLKKIWSISNTENSKSCQAIETGYNGSSIFCIEEDHQLYIMIQH